MLILGAGMLGVNATAWARMHGAAEVYVADVSESRLEQAARFGASMRLPFIGNGAAMIDEVRARTGGRGIDLAIELSGSPVAADAAIQSLRIGGRAVFVGAVAPTAPISIDPEQIVRRLLTIRGLHNYVPNDLVAAVAFLHDALPKYPFAELIGPPFPLADVAAAFAESLTGRSLRVAVQP